MNAAPTAHMRQRRVRKVQNSPSSLHQTSAEISIFPIKEEAFVHSTDLVESGPAYEHAGARHPVDFERSRRMIERRKIAPRERVVREAACQPGAAARDTRRQV